MGDLQEIAAASTGRSSPEASTSLAVESLEECPVDSGAVQQKALGLQILAPHYQTIHLQVDAENVEGPEDVLAAASQEAVRQLHEDLGDVAPCDPQLFVDYASVVAVPAYLYARDQVVVVVDLLQLGAQRFACVLPSCATYREVTHFFRTLAGSDCPDFALFLGRGGNPHNEGENLQLGNGTVIFAVPLGKRPHHGGRFVDLVAAPELWGPADQYPRPLAKPGMCLLCGLVRYFVNKRHYPGQPPGEVAAWTAGLDPANITLRIAQPPGLQNVSLHGQTCKGVACILPFATPAEGERDDNICFFDLRPIGHKPMHHFQVGAVRHIPTILDSFGVQAAGAYKFEWDVPGTREGFATVSSGGTVTVRAVRVTARADAGPVPPDHGDDDPNGPPPPDDEDDDSDRDPDDCADDSSAHSSGSNWRPRSRSPRRYGAAGCTAASSGHANDSEDCRVLVAAAGNKWFSWVLDIDALCWSAGFITPFPAWLSPHKGSEALTCQHPAPSDLLRGSAQLSAGGVFDLWSRWLRTACTVVCTCVGRLKLSRAKWRCVRCKGADEATRFVRRDDSQGEAAQGRAHPRLPRDEPEHYGVPDLLVDRPETAAQHLPPVLRPWQFLLLSPELSREQVELRLAVPCTVQSAVEAISQVRDDNRQMLYDHFEPVVPQPDDTFGTFLCVPGWAAAHTVVCIDTREIDGRLFSLCLPERMNRESLLAAADLEQLHDVSVHIGSSWVPLRPWQLAHLVPGILVSFVPGHRMFRPGVSLQLMLLRRDGWVADPQVTGNLFERSFYVLTDAWPVRFLAEGCTRDTFRADLSAQLRAAVDRLSIQPSLPNLADFELQGRICHRVLVATEGIVRLPVLPGRPRSSLHPCLLDLRPVLRGLKWVFAEQGLISVLQVLRMHVPAPPRRMRANILGGSITHRADGPWLQVWPGQVLTVHFLWDEADSEEEGTTGSWPSDNDDDDPQGPEASPHSSHASGSDANDSTMPPDPRTLPTGYETPPTRRWRPLGPSESLCEGIFDRRGGARRWLGKPGTVASMLVWCCVVLLCDQCPTGALATQLPALEIATAAVVPDQLGSSCSSSQIAHPDHAVCQTTASHSHHGFAASRNGPVPVGARPVPTPCRSLGGGPFPGPTLLEQSRQASQDYPLWEARTLIETLLQRARAPARTEHHGSAARVVSLTSCLPVCREIDVSRPAIPIGRTLDEVMPFFLTRWPLQSALPPAFPLHPAAFQLFAGHLLEPPASCSPPWIELYTDGSFDGTTSTWAFAAFAIWPQGTLFLGFARGRVSLEGEPHFIGADQHSALNGERSALFWAVAWSLQLDSVRCTVWSDCLVAKGQTEGSCNTVAHAVLGRACRAVSLAAEASGRLHTGAFEHVRAHVGHAYNELVDGLAKTCPHCFGDIPASIAALSDWVTSGDIHWLWLVIESVRRPHCWPRHEAGSLVDAGTVGEADVARLSAGAFGRRLIRGEVSPPSEKIILLSPSFVSINVQTLQEDRSVGLQGRTPFIREQLEALQVCITGLQETRAAKAETVTSATHLRYISPREMSRVVMG